MLTTGGRPVFLLVILLLAIGVRAQDEPIRVKDVEVTAEKRREVLSDVPQSVTVIEDDELESGLFQDIRDASFYVPNLFISGFAPRHTAYPFFRGLGGSGQGEPAVTTYLDGVPQLTFSTLDSELLDIQRIEFIRGAQGTLYGRNALGGAIQLVTRRPAREFGLETSMGIGNYGLQRYKLRLDAPLVKDTAFLAFSGGYTTRDGYTENTATGNAIDNRESLAGRAQLLLTPSDNVEILFALFAERDRDGDYVLAPLSQLQNDTHHVSHDYEGYNDRDLVTPSLTIHVYGDNVDFVSISSFEHWATQSSTDTDFSIANMVRRYVEEEQNAFYQEFRLQSPENAPLELDGEDLVLQWLTGVSYSNSTLSHHGSDIVPLYASSILRDYDLDDQALGIFGETTLTIGGKLDLTAGLRYQGERKEWDTYTAVPAALGGPATRNVHDAESFEQWLPRFGIAYRWTPTFMTYVSAAKGYRSGGYNQNTSVTGPVTYEEETSWTYETGLKSSWFDRRLQLSLALFYVDWKNMQLSVANPYETTSTYLQNVGHARSQGFEAELVAKLTRHLTWYAGYGLAETRFIDYTDPNTHANYEGGNVPNVPNYTWNTGLEVRTRPADQWELYTRADLVGFGEIPYDAANAMGEGPVTLVNLRAGASWQRWQIEAWVANLLDKEYIPLAFDFGGGNYIGRNGDPRTLGLTLSVKF